MKGGARPYRRVVPSPDPVKIFEADAREAIIRSGSMVVAGGGGGIPVVEREGALEGVDAVIDKDLGAERLAEDVGAEALLILTNVDAVKVGFGTPKERSLRTMTVEEAKELMAAGEFPPGAWGRRSSPASGSSNMGGGRGSSPRWRTLWKRSEGMPGPGCSVPPRREPLDCRRGRWPAGPSRRSRRPSSSRGYLRAP